MGTNWRIGSLLGIPLYLDSSWFLILGLVTLVNAGEINAMGLSGGMPILGWMVGLAMALLLFASVLLHELGHSLVARSQGIEVKSITLFLFGGVASIERESKTPGEAFFVAIAGPVVSLFLFGLFSALMPVFEQSRLLQFLAQDLARINLVIAIFNLIPGLPLDGGQVLKALVWKITGDRFAGIRWAAASGKLLGWMGISLGLFLLFATGDIGAIWIALISWFVLRNATAYEQLNQLRKTLLELVAADVMAHDFRVVNAHLSLAEFAQEYILNHTNSSLSYYGAANGRYRGLIRLEDLQAIDNTQWHSITLEEIAHPLTEIPSVEEKTPLVEVINHLEKIQDKRITVLSPAGAVSGTIDRADVVKAVVKSQNLAIPEAEIKRIKAEGAYPPYLKLDAIAKGILKGDF